MDYYCFIHSVVSFVENRVKTGTGNSEIEKVTGFSFPHIRDVFKRCTNMSFARYVLFRRVSNAAFEMAHTGRSLLDISLDYGFDTYDTFTRAFKRITGITPQEFRKRGLEVGRVRLAGGAYGPGIGMDAKTDSAVPSYLKEIFDMKTMTNPNRAAFYTVFQRYSTNMKNVLLFLHACGHVSVISVRRSAIAILWLHREPPSVLGGTPNTGTAEM